MEWKSIIHENKVKIYLHFWEISPQFLKMLTLLGVLDALKIERKTRLEKRKTNPFICTRSCLLWVSLDLEKKQLKVCYFTKNSPSLKWTKQTETKLPSIQQFGQSVSFSLHALWTALTFKSWNALWDTILKIGDEPWPTTTLVLSMCFTHMTQGDLAHLFENLSYRKNAKASKNIFL